MRVKLAVTSGRKSPRGYCAGLLGIWLFLAGPFTVSAALAEAEHPYLTEKHLITLGGYRQQSKASLTAARENFEPTPVDLESMGLKDRDTTWMGEYRFRKILAGSTPHQPIAIVRVLVSQQRIPLILMAYR